MTQSNCYAEGLLLICFHANLYYFIIFVLNIFWNILNILCDRYIFITFIFLLLSPAKPPADDTAADDHENHYNDTNDKDTGHISNRCPF
jgi:hypothetical protein